jgi:hypothetical protein
MTIILHAEPQSQLRKSTHDNVHVTLRSGEQLLDSGHAEYA